MVNKPPCISGSLIDHVYIKKTLIAEFSIKTTVENIYFSNYDVIRIAIEKNNVDFQKKKIQYDQAIKKNVIVF